MQNRFMRFFTSWSLVQRFSIVSLMIIIAGALGVGWWVGEEIKTGVINESAANAALYLDSFISPHLQELHQIKILPADHVVMLNDLLRETDLGGRVLAFKIWNADGNVLYSKGPSLFSDVFPNMADQARVWRGEIVAGISASPAEKKLEEEKFGTRLLQIYSPVRLSGTDQVIAIAEFYERADTLEAEVIAAQRRSWLVVGLAMSGIYLLLVGFVRWAGSTINRQALELTKQVARLTELLAQNDELRARVQRAAANATAHNERSLRRISAELHDGPTQELGLALLRLDRVVGQNEICRLAHPESACNQQLPQIQSALQSALQEMRSIAAGFGLPQLDRLSFSDVLKRVVHVHERRTGSRVVLHVENLPDAATIPVKITTYRLIQEALSNAHRHANGIGQRVSVVHAAGLLHIEIADDGPGFDVASSLASDEHLGLSGMRERVESLGGWFKIESEVGRGTKIIAYLPPQTAGGNTND